MVKIFFGAYLNFLLFLFSYIIPKKKNLYLIGSRWGKEFAENSKYVYIYANKQKVNKKFLWITESTSVFKILKNKNLPVVKKNSLKGFWSILRSSKIIFSSGTRDIAYFSFLFGKFKFIELWHGSPIKSISFSRAKNIKERIVKWGLKKQLKKYLFVLHTCEKNKKLIEKGFLTKKIKILGYPRNDGLFNAINFEKEIRLNEFKKVILYMPTFRDTRSLKKPFTASGLRKLNLFLKKHSFLFLIKKHPAEKNWKLFNEYSNILDISDISDPNEIMAKTDILISDYSGAPLDFSILNKPIIFYPYDYTEYSMKSRKMGINYYEDLPGPFAKNESELLDLLKKTERWFSDINYIKKYKHFAESFNKYRDAKSSKRVYKEIIKK